MLSLINPDVRGYRVLIVVCQDSRIYEANPHVPEHNRLLDCGAATQNICLMAHALGLGACWATFREPQTRKVREYFEVPDYVDIVTCVALGWPAEEVAAPARINWKRQSCIPWRHDDGCGEIRPGTGRAQMSRSHERKGDRQWVQTC
ncbi:MAG: nitroreductase family protein [Bacillota bacterium]